MSADGSRAYRTVGDVPLLVADGDGGPIDGSAIAAGGQASGGGRLRAALRRLAPSPTLNPQAGLRYREFAGLVEQQAADRRARVLVIGGGTLGKGMEELAASRSLDLVETDVYLGPRVRVACDAHALPFADGAFDAAIAQAVLEHVLDPAQVVAEIHRVLAPGGLVYAETPFMQQVHEGAFDFTRFTELGQRRLFRGFEEVRRGVAVGPASALVWSLRYLARSLPRRPGPLVTVLDRLALLAFSWLKHLDRVLVDRPGASDGASAVYFVGRRAERPASDTEIVRGYRGLVRTAAWDRLGAGTST